MPRGSSKIVREVFAGGKRKTIHDLISLEEF
jgi:hypothetical protein